MHLNLDTVSMQSVKRSRPKPLKPFRRPSQVGLFGPVPGEPARPALEPPLDKHLVWRET